MKRNPHAPSGAMTREDLRPGQKIVIIKGGLYTHKLATVMSKPYKETGPFASLYDRKTGKVGTATYLAVKLRVPTTNPFRRGETYVTEAHLADMGLWPDHEGRWSLHYTVKAEDYDPRNQVDFIRQRPRRGK